MQTKINQTQSLYNSTNTFRMKAVAFHLEYYTFSIKYILHTYSQPIEQPKAYRTRTIETVSVHYIQLVILHPPTLPFSLSCSLLHRGKPAYLVLSGPIGA